MNYTVVKKENFTKIRNQASSYYRRNELLMTLGMITISILMILCIQLIVRLSASLYININMFSIWIEIPLLIIFSISFIICSVSEHLLKDESFEYFNKNKKKDKMLLNFLNDYIVYENDKVKPAHYFMKPELSTEDKIVFHFPKDYRKVIENKTRTNPQFDYEYKENAIIRYGREHFKPVKKRDVIKRIQPLIDDEKEYQRHKKNNKENEYYEHIKRNNITKDKPVNKANPLSENIQNDLNKALDEEQLLLVEKKKIIEKMK